MVIEAAAEPINLFRSEAPRDERQRSSDNDQIHDHTRCHAGEERPNHARVDARAIHVRPERFARCARPLLQRVYVVLDVGPDAFADGDGLQLRQPRVPLIAGLEERRRSQ